jgi:hypothetical protein
MPPPGGVPPAEEKDRPRGYGLSRGAAPASEPAAGLPVLEAEARGSETEDLSIAEQKAKGQPADALESSGQADRSEAEGERALRFEADVKGEHDRTESAAAPMAGFQMQIAPEQLPGNPPSPTDAWYWRPRPGMKALDPSLLDQVVLLLNRLGFVTPLPRDEWPHDVRILVVQGETRELQEVVEGLQAIDAGEVGGSDMGRGRLLIMLGGDQLEAPPAILDEASEHVPSSPAAEESVNSPQSDRPS